jgi:uncharacterized protein YciI
MLFAIIALLKPGADEELIKYSGELNEQIGANAEKISVAGALRDEDRQRRGYLAFFEGDSIADARKWMHESPIYRDHLYEQVEVLQYEVEIGHLG